MHPKLRDSVDSFTARWISNRNRIFEHKFKDVFGFIPTIDRSNGYRFHAYDEEWSLDGDDLVWHKRDSVLKTFIRSPRDFALAYDEV